MLSHRLGTPPPNRVGLNSTNSGGCPDIIEVIEPRALGLPGTRAMREGVVHLVVGTRVTKEQLKAAGPPSDLIVAPYESVVAIPDEVFFDAAVALLQERNLVGSEELLYTLPHAAATTK